MIVTGVHCTRDKNMRMSIIFSSTVILPHKYNIFSIVVISEIPKTTKELPKVYC